jgi:hypothetical protein
MAIRVYFVPEENVIIEYIDEALEKANYGDKTDNRRDS